MKKVRMSLRLHIFIAFLVVFLISFGGIVVAFRLIVQGYIEDDVHEKLTDSMELARNVGKESQKNPVLPSSIKIMSEDELVTSTIVNNLISGIEMNSDVDAALLSIDGDIEWPKADNSVSENQVVADIIAKYDIDSIESDNGKIRKISVDGSVYYVTSIKTTVESYPPGTESIKDNDKFILLYINANPYEDFADNIYDILYFILITGLILCLFASFIVANSIIRSIQKLTKFASRIGSGLFKRQDFHFFDKELDNLADDMNVMATKLDQTDKEQKTFFQNASHELRTPLMSIQGYAEGIKYNVFDNQENAADVIISESQRLTSMVENLLSISRMDTAAAGRQEVAKHPIDIKELLDSVVEKVRGGAILSQKNISLHFTSENPHILGNENDLFRAFENIFSNAIRYAHNTIDVTISSVSKQSVLISITDDGNGISEDLLPRIFDRFTQGEGGKHGIGLALVKSIVLEHHGEITAANRTDGKTGAVFEMTLPLISTTIEN